jgi:hypothetical protein
MIKHEDLILINVSISCDPREEAVPWGGGGLVVVGGCEADLT